MPAGQETKVALPIVIFITTLLVAFASSILVRPLVSVGIAPLVADEIYNFIGHGIFIIGAVIMLAASGFTLKKVSFLPRYGVNVKLFVIIAALFGAFGFSINFIPPLTKVVAPPFVWVLDFLYQAFFVGWSEEILFRGSLQNILNARFPNSLILRFRAGTFISAVIFGLVHLGNSFLGLPLLTAVAEAIFALSFGFVVGWYYDRTQDLAGAAWIHNVTDGFNALALLIISLF